LIAGLERVTPASAIGEPAVSLTIPLIEPLVLCPKQIAVIGNESDRARIDHLKRSLAIIFAS
jgi:hypothetical protein